MFPIAFVFMMSVMGGYAKDYEGAVQATNEMSSSMIEYINGIEVIKAFNQGKTSYARLAEKVRANAQYYFDWMRRSQLGMSMAYAFFPAQMLTLLPFGWLFYTHGTLSIGTFLTVIIDPENEAVIQSALGRLVRGKTLLVIAHRLSTIADADQIIVVNQGKIEATGTQAELLASCPLYQTMWEAHISVKDDGEVA
mgnify:CR=1 FL=1